MFCNASAIQLKRYGIGGALLLIFILTSCGGKTGSNSKTLSIANNSSQNKKDATLNSNNTSNANPGDNPLEIHSPAADSSQTENTALLERGKKLYRAHCIACHNANPLKNGPTGPDLAGSSLELLKLRLWELKYPEGYKPKRSTRQMTAFKFLKEEDIRALHAWINAEEHKK